MANLGAGLLQGFPSATSGSRTVVADQMGGKSQLVGLIAAGLTIVFLLFLTPLLAPLPTVVLGAIIITASFGLLDVYSFRVLRRVRQAEFWLAIVTLFGVLTVGILQGILVAVTLSLVNVIFRISRPHDALLDDVDQGGRVVYRSVADKGTSLTEPGLIVYRFDAPLIFANAAFFSERLGDLTASAGEGLKCVILDAEAISDFDSTAAEALENLDRSLEQAGVEFWLARANQPLRELLHLTGLTKQLGRNNIYPSVRAAVDAYRARYGEGS
jgi:SulP family sulfate permease